MITTGSPRIVANSGSEFTLRREPPRRESRRALAREIDTLPHSEGRAFMARTTAGVALPDHHVVTARDSTGKLAGAIHYEYSPRGGGENPDPHVYVHSLGSVAKGAGTALLHHALWHAAARGVGIALAAEEGSPAEGFYRHVGLSDAGPSEEEGGRRYEAGPGTVKDILARRPA